MFRDSKYGHRAVNLVCIGSFVIRSFVCNNNVLNKFYNPKFENKDKFGVGQTVFI